LSILDGKPETYKEFADEYFVQEDGAPSDHSLPIIQHVFQQLPLTDDHIRILNPKVGLYALAEEIYETIGYPRDDGQSSAESDRGRHPGLLSFNLLAGGPGG
jgi:hypothetical protein